MSYAAIGQAGFRQRGAALGAEDKGQADAYEKIARDCTEKLKNQDWDSKAGREAGVKKAAECAGKGVCLYLSEGAAPPEVLNLCGDIARKIVGPVIDVWNDIFGNADEWKAEYERRARSAETRRIRRQYQELVLEMGATFLQAAAHIIELNDKLIPEERGKLGVLGGSNTVTFADGRVLKYRGGLCPRMEPAKQLIVRLGNAQRLTTTAPCYDSSTGRVIGNVLNYPLPPATATASVLDAWVKTYVIPFMAAVKRGEALAAAQVTARAAAWETARKSAKGGSAELMVAAQRSARMTRLINSGLFVLGAGVLLWAWRRG